MSRLMFFTIFSRIRFHPGRWCRGRPFRFLWYRLASDNVHKGISVPSKGLPVLPAGSFGKYAGPVNGKAVAFQAKCFHMCYVFFESVIVVACYITGMSFVDSSWFFCKYVPDVQAFTGVFSCAFNLIGTGCRAHTKSFANPIFLYLLFILVFLN